MLEIRRLDKYNFTLGERLPEPKVSTVKFKGKETELVSTHTNRKVYYGTLHGAIIGLIKHDKLNLNREDIPSRFLKVKPYSDEELYIDFLEVPKGQILSLIEKEYNG